MTVLEAASAPIARIDPAGIIVYWNNALYRLTGVSHEEALGRNFLQSYIDTDTDSVAANQIQRVLSGRDTMQHEVRIRAKNDELVSVRLDWTPQVGQGGAIVGAVAIGQDITSLKRSQAEIIQASKLATLGEMATSVAHELNQPLNVIRMSAGNAVRKIRRDPSGLDYVIEKLERIEKQTIRAAKIIDHLRSYGRKDQGACSAIDLEASVDLAIGMVAEQYRLNEIVLEKTFPMAPVMVRADPVQLEQVFFNLLTNARDAVQRHQSDVPGRVIVDVRLVADGKSVMVTVIDNGCGVPENARGRIFEPFYSTKPKGQGTGLGLAVSDSLVRDLGGEIRLQANTPGAAFDVVLPTADNVL